MIGFDRALMVARSFGTTAKPRTIRMRNQRAVTDAFRQHCNELNASQAMSPSVPALHGCISDAERRHRARPHAGTTPC